MRNAALLLLAALAFAVFAEPEPSTIGRPYPARVAAVHDGDTIDVDIDLGFDTWKHDVPIRMLDVYAPELSEATGPAAASKMKELLPVGALITLRPVMVGKPPHEKQTFARYVARVWRDKVDVCDAMAQWLGTKQGTGASKAKP